MRSKRKLNHNTLLREVTFQKKSFREKIVYMSKTASNGMIFNGWVKLDSTNVQNPSNCCCKGSFSYTFGVYLVNEHKICFDKATLTLKYVVLRAPHACSIQWPIYRYIIRGRLSYWAYFVFNDWCWSMQNSINQQYTLRFLLKLVRTPSNNLLRGF